MSVRRLEKLSRRLEALHIQADQISCWLGRSKRKTEAYVGWYVERLSEARTTLAADFISLC